MSDVTLPTTLDRIIWNDGSARIGGVEVDGRLLVDGPADNSQNWSTFTTDRPSSGNAGTPWSNLFDGNLSTVFYGTPNYTEIFTPPTKIEGAVRIWGRSHDVDSLKVEVDNGSGYVDFTAQFRANGAANAANWVECGTDLVAVKFQSGGNGNQVPEANAIEVDGKILIDAGA